MEVLSAVAKMARYVYEVPSQLFYTSTSKQSHHQFLPSTATPGVHMEPELGARPYLRDESTWLGRVWCTKYRLGSWVSPPRPQSTTIIVVGICSTPINGFPPVNRNQMILLGISSAEIFEISDLDGTNVHKGPITLGEGS